MSQRRGAAGTLGRRVIPGLHFAAVPGGHERARIFSSRRREHHVGSVIKKRRKRMAKKKHRKLLKKTRVQRRNKK
jgi:hypothetical protein